MPTSFALGMMVWFYLISPWLILAGPRPLILSMFISYGSMLVFGPMFVYGGYFVWVFWWWLFALGALTATAVERWKSFFQMEAPSSPVLRWIILILIAGSLLALLTTGAEVPPLAFAVLVACALPILAEVSRESWTDRLLGMLSYPVFCSLTLGLSTSSVLVESGVLVDSSRLAYSVIFGLSFAGLFVILVERPLLGMRASWRRRLGSNQRPSV